VGSDVFSSHHFTWYQDDGRARTAFRKAHVLTSGTGGKRGICGQASGERRKAQRSGDICCVVSGVLSNGRGQQQQLADENRQAKALSLPTTLLGV